METAACLLPEGILAYYDKFEVKYGFLWLGQLLSIVWTIFRYTRWQVSAR